MHILILHLMQAVMTSGWGQDVAHACRDKEHSTIIYESPQPDTPLLRLGWNKQDPRYMATLLMDSSKVVVLDIR